MSGQQSGLLHVFHFSMFIARTCICVLLENVGLYRFLMKIDFSFLCSALPLLYVYAQMRTDKEDRVKEIEIGWRAEEREQ